MQSIGKLLQYNVIENDIVLESSEEKLKISLMEKGGFKIHAIKSNEKFEDFSYSVSNAKTSPLNILMDEEDYLIISSGEFHLRVEKNPIRLSFETLEEIIINRDEPSFGISWDGDEVCNYKSLQKDEIFTGLGEKTGPLNKAGRQYIHWNTDEFGYHQDTDPLYASTPFYFARANGLWYGIFLDNTSKTTFNFGASNHRFSFFKTERGQLRYYFFHSENPYEILNQYCSLTGYTPLPPKWSLGYQQCRYSYYPDKELLSLARTFREKNIPADVLYLDIHYMDDYKVFTWHPDRFPNPKKLLDELKELGFKIVVIVDPGVKVENGYEVMEDGLKNDVFLKYPDGENYIGEAWPGQIYLPDFTREESRNWWASKFQKLVDDGIDGFWNDMNEPAVWGKNVPDLVEFDYDGHSKNHKEGHNIYGMQMARSTNEGAKKALKGKRPFVLTRAAFSGIQRFSALWTGDNVSDPNHLFLGARLITQLGLVGVPFSGNDVGGFIGESSIPLFQRWIVLGAFTPFYRGHTMINSRDAEPWSFGEEAEEIARNYISLRYKLMPYIYSIFYEHTKNAKPLCRALFLDYPDDDLLFSGPYQSQYLFGPSLLICPIGPDEYLKKVYLPEGKWYDFFTDEIYEGKKEYVLEFPNDKLPVFVKSNAIIPSQNPVQNNQIKNDGTLRLHLYNGFSETQFELYEDDGESCAFEDGNYLNILFELTSNSLNIKYLNHKFKNPYNKMKLYFHGFENIKNVKYSGIESNLEKEDFRFINPISNFDPFEDNADKSKIIKGLRYHEIDFPNSDLKIEFI